MYSLLLLCVFSSIVQCTTVKLSECQRITKFCKVQCNFGGNFQKNVCINECVKNGITCNYLSSCTILNRKQETLTLISQEKSSAATSESCFHDFAREYFCNHIYYPCMTSCLKESITKCAICEKRRSFCECGLDIYISKKFVKDLQHSSLDLYNSGHDRSDQGVNDQGLKNNDRNVRDQYSTDQTKPDQIIPEQTTEYPGFISDFKSYLGEKYQGVKVPKFT